VSLATLLIVCLCFVPALAGAWWKSDWGYRKRIELEPAVLTTATGAGLADIVVPVRLHLGNFNYFGDTKPDGSDLRFVAADDSTPLEFRIERYDASAGVAVLWVRVPVARLTAERSYVWMYYGNRDAVSVANSHVADTNTVLSFDFAESSGAPRDATAYGTNATLSSAQAGVPGVIDLGLGFGPSSSVELPTSPTLSFVTKNGFSLSAWVKPETESSQGLLYSQSGSGGRLTVSVGDGRVVATALSGAAPTSVDAVLPADGWHAIGVSLGEQLKLYVDGREAGARPVPSFALDGAAQLGAADSATAFRGSLDVLRLSNVVRPAAWFALEHDLQAPDSTRVRAAADESRSEGGWKAELGLMRRLMGSVTIDGWMVIGVIGILGLVSADVLVRKLRLVDRTERGDRDFLAGFATAWQRDLAALRVAGGATEGTGADNPPASVLARVYAAGMRELAATPSVCGHRYVSRETVEVIRGALDAAVVQETEQLQRRLVLMTIAVSGGPFLGLLGTVVGVMITFASIAATGDVNVNTIAPGVAAALFATVMGLLVAIPSLFGYNFVASRIAARVAAMEVFADQMVGRMHAAFAGERAEGPDHAP
jgi:biopolymer transport protein ExbB